jgi:hypothetical protein
MKTIVKEQIVKVIKIEYDSITEWIEDCNKMVEKGWIEGDTEFENEKYYQEFSKYVENKKGESVCNQ